MATSMDFNKFLSHYGKIVYAVENLRTNPLLRTPGMVNGCMQAIDQMPALEETTNAAQMQNADDILLAIKGMIGHLQLLREEICKLEQVSVPLETGTGQTTKFQGNTNAVFVVFLSTYKKTIGEVDKVRADSESRKNVKKVTRGLEIIDGTCSIIIQLNISSDDFKMQFTAVCGMLEHLQNVRTEINELLPNANHEIQRNFMSYIPSWIVAFFPFVLKIVANICVMASPQNIIGQIAVIVLNFIPTPQNIKKLENYVCANMFKLFKILKKKTSPIMKIIEIMQTLDYKQIIQAFKEFANEYRGHLL